MALFARRDEGTLGCRPIYRRVQTRRTPFEHWGRHRAGYPEVIQFVLPSGLGEGKSKENVDEGSPGANATKEKAFVGLWNPGSRGHDDQTAASLIGSAPMMFSGRCGVSPLKWGAGRRRVFGFRVGEKTFSP
jgi:hypothetical protein